MRIDEEVAAVINQNKEDFYNKYNYLKPDAEKNFLEICFDSAAEWCKEHWKEILIGLSLLLSEHYYHGLLVVLFYQCYFPD